MRLSLATWDHDRVMALHDGRVRVPGVEFEAQVLPTGQLFRGAVADAPFDVTELSLSSHILQVSRGDSAYVGLPAFVSRAFRHGGFFVRDGSGLDSLGDFAGRVVGVPEYQMTAALWMRGVLADDYGVRAQDMRWRTGALDAGVRRERLALAAVEGLSVEPIAEGETLQDLLLDGAIDALLAPQPPRAWLEGDLRIRRVFDDVEAAEQAWFARTGLFPVMHLIGLRREIADAHPWLPAALTAAFGRAKEMALERLREVWLSSANRLSLPWFGASMERTIRTLGPDYWPYGVARNRAELEAACRYSREQGLAARDVAVEELFHPAAIDLGEAGAIEATA